MFPCFFHVPTRGRSPPFHSAHLPKAPAKCSDNLQGLVHLKDPSTHSMLFIYIICKRFSIVRYSLFIPQSQYEGHVLSKEQPIDTIVVRSMLTPEFNFFHCRWSVQIWDVCGILEIIEPDWKGWLTSKEYGTTRDFAPSRRYMELESWKKHFNFCVFCGMFDCLGVFTLTFWHPGVPEVSRTLHGFVTCVWLLWHVVGHGVTVVTVDGRCRADGAGRRWPARGEPRRSRRNRNAIRAAARATRAVGGAGTRRAAAEWGIGGFGQVDVETTEEWVLRRANQCCVLQHALERRSCCGEGCILWFSVLLIVTADSPKQISCLLTKYSWKKSSKT